MANRKNYYYVLVLTNGGPVFVTDTKPNHYAEFNKLEIPKDFGKEMANDIAMGLSLNGNVAYPVCVPYEMETQPYCYNMGHFEWVWDKDKENADE